MPTMIRFNGAAAGLTLAAALLAPAARAQTPSAPQPAPAPRPATPTFSISITEAAEIIEAVGTTRRLDRNAIERLHARTLDEALRYLPGVYVRTGGDGTPRIDVRGFRSRHVLLLMDGVPINSTNDGQFDPRRISTESIREITVSYGSSSMLYGDNALAGVIEITTVNAGAGAHGAAALSAGQSDEYQLNGRFEGGRGPLTVVVSGDVYDTDGFRLAGDFSPTANQPDARLRANSAVNRRGLLAKAGYASSSAIRLGAELSFTDGAFGQPPITAISATDPFAQQVRFERVNDLESMAVQGSFAYRPAAGLNVQAWAYRNSEDEDRARYDDATYSSMSNRLISGTFQELNRTRLTGGQTLARFDLGRAGWLRASLSGRHESFNTTGTIRDVGASVGSGGGGSGGGGRGGGSTSAPAVFNTRVFDESSAVNVLSTGGEWEFRPARAAGVVLGISQHWQLRDGADGETGTAWLAGVSYDMRPDLRLHLSATRKIRFPSLQQLYDPASGDTSLETEQAYDVEAGVDKSWGESHVSVAGFATRAANFIERNGGARYSNRDRYRFSGVELAVDSPLARMLRLHAVYSFLDSQDRSGDGATAGLQYRPRHRMLVDTRWALHRRVDARLALQYVADQVYFSRGTPAIEATADDYTVTDVSIDARLSNHLTLSVVGGNLFDRFYEQAYGFPREGRTFRVGARTAF